MIAALLLSSGLGLLPFVVSEEFALDAPVAAPAAGDQLWPALAAGGGVHLAVWVEARPDGEADVVALRLGADGTPLDPAPLVVAAGGQRSRTRPAVAWSDAAFLVVWEERSPFGDGLRLAGARVDASGARLDAEALEIAWSGSPALPAVAGGPDGWLVAWEAYGGGGSQVRAMRVAADGGLRDLTPLVIAGGGAAIAQMPAVAFGGTDYLVAWRRCELECSLRVGRVAPDGTLRDPGGVVVAAGGGVGWPTLAAGDVGGGYLVAWQAWGDAGDDVVAARLDADGIPDAGGVRTIASAPGVKQWPRAAWDGERWVVAWQDGRNQPARPAPDLYVARLGGDGAPLDPPGGREVGSMAETQQPPALAPTGAGWLVAWFRQGGRTGFDVMLARLPATGAPSAPAPLAEGANAQDEPAVAWGGDAWLVAWRDGRRPGGAADVVAVRVAADGTVLDPEALVLTADGAAQGSPRVAAGEGGWLVVWDDARNGNLDVYGARVATDGALLDPGGFAITTVPIAQQRPQVAWGDGSWLVVWLDNRSGAFAWYVYGARVGADGAVLDPNGIGITFATPTSHGPVVAWNGASWQVVWEDDRTLDRDLYGARVSAAGQVLDPDGVPVAVAPGTQERPALASRGDGVLVVWQDGRAGDVDVMAARISRRGAVLDPGGIALASGAGLQAEPAVAWDGAAYAVAWAARGADGEWDLWLTSVGGGGGVLVPGGGLLAAAAASPERRPALASDGRGAVLAAYDRWVDDPAVRAPRVRARVVTGGPGGGDPDDGDGGGCGCRVGGRRPDGGAAGRAAAALLVAIAALAALGTIGVIGTIAGRRAARRS